MKKVENRQHFTLYIYALISLIVTDIFVIIFLVVHILSKQKIYVIIVILLIRVYFINYGLFYYKGYSKLSKILYIKRRVLL